jgi:hypothetical protein
MTDRRWLVGCGIAGALLAVALSWDFFTLSLDPWPDQAWILLAAERHHRGLGLTTTLESSSDDLAVTDYHRLVYFPPGYPLLLSALRSTGASMETIVKAINALALVAGFFGWMWLAGGLLTSRAARLIFALLLVLACRGTIPRGGTTDYVFWALLPFWFLFMEKRRLVWAGVVVAVMIGFRWAAVVLIPAGVLLELGTPVAAATYAIIPTLTFGGISLANRLLSGQASSILSYVKSSWRFDLLATLYPFEAVFARPLALEPLLSRIWRVLPAAGIVFRFVIPLILIALLARSVKLDRFGRLVALVYLCLVGLLAYMTVRHTWIGVNWSYLEEPRYYMPFFPAIALFWLRVPRRPWFVVLGIAVLYLGQAEARWTMTRLRAGEEDASLLAQLAAMRNSPARSVVFDNDISRYLLWDSDGFSPRLYPPSAQSLHTSKPVDVWIVERIGQKTAYVSDPQFDRKRLDALRARFNPALVWSDARFRLYRATVSAPPPARAGT